MSAGTYTFSNLDIYVPAGTTYILPNNTNNPNIIIEGGFTRTILGTLNYTKGSGTITFRGSNNQSIDFGGNTVEEIIINKSAGNVRFDGGFTADYLQATGTLGAHTIDINGQTGIILTGALTLTKSANGPRFETAGASADMQNGKIKIGAASVINGYAASQLAVNNLDFDLNSQTLTATYATITSSDCTNGTGDATAETNVDGGSNTAWDFGVVAGAHRRPWAYAFAAPCIWGAV